MRESQAIAQTRIPPYRFAMSIPSGFQPFHPIFSINKQTINENPNQVREFERYNAL
jgi:hypothetical protein